jgi:menaquinone-specific isochorismate synthase
MTTSDVTLRAAARLRAHSVAGEAPVDLLDAYSADGFAWIDGERGFVTSGVAAVVAPSDAVSFLATIEHSTAGDSVPASAGPRAVGALPFTGSGDLVVPAHIVGRDARGQVWRTDITLDEPGLDDTGLDAPAAAGAERRTAPPAEFRVTAATTRDEWRAMVESVLADIGRGSLAKVVLARAVHVDADQPFDVADVLAFLRRSQPGCIVYGDRGFVGASPELLVRKTAASVVCRPLAGTGTDTAALARSAKDAHEHHFVVDAVATTLAGFCSDVRADGPALLELADVSHLATTITGRLERAAISVVDLVAALHPTPAVGGTPRRLALDAIAAREPTPRGRYAGPCGWVDRNGDGEFVVALRGGVITGTHALIHAGAGIVSGSDPDAEWTETQQKLTPMLQALVRP